MFQWSQVSRHPEWKPNIDAWFKRFQNKFEWDKANNNVVRRVWENHAATRLRDFWYDTQKQSKRNARDNGLEGWNEVAV